MRKPLRVQLTVFAYGGIVRETMLALIAEITHQREGRTIAWSITSPGDDALIDRSRSRALAQSIAAHADVAVFLDHDVEWQPGDLGDLAMRAHATPAIVSGIYPFKAMGRGMAWKPARAVTRFTLGEDTLVPAQGLPTGFMAIPIPPVAVALTSLETEPNPDLRVRWCRRGTERYRDAFRPVSMHWEGEAEDADYSYVGEDQSFCLRMLHAGLSCYAWMRPMLIHHGTYGYGPQDAAKAATNG